MRSIKQAFNQASDAAQQAKFDLSALQQEGEQLVDQVVQVGPRVQAWAMYGGVAVSA